MYKTTPVTGRQSDSQRFALSVGLYLPAMDRLSWELLFTKSSPEVGQIVHNVAGNPILASEKLMLAEMISYRELSRETRGVS